MHPRGPSRLVWRHWHITDGEGRTHAVHGSGVVGQFPVLDRATPGFEYFSSCVLPTPRGCVSVGAGVDCGLLAPGGVSIAESATFALCDANARVLSDKGCILTAPRVARLLCSDFIFTGLEAIF
jgi:hypothetical protein